MKALTTLMLSTALLASGAAIADDDDYRKKYKRGDYYERHSHDHHKKSHKRYKGDDQRYFKDHRSGDRFFCDDHDRHHDFSDFRRYHGGDERLFAKHLKRHHRDDHGWAKHHGRYARHGDVLRLDIPVRIRGDEHIGLKRLVRERYGVDPRDYRLRKVVVTNRGHRPAAARLRVGDDYSRVTYLNGGNNHIRAPRGPQYGRWVLGVENARISNIRVVLEPKHRWAGRYSPAPRRGWFDDRWSVWLNF